MEKDIKPIETIYDGYRFRSRLEARWAVFFDVLGIKYEYEPEGYQCKDGTRYLPDFYLPNAHRWVEIKAKKLSEEEIKKCASFCDALDEEGVKFTIIIGQPFDNVVGLKIGADTVTKVSNLEEADMVAISAHSYEWKTYDVTYPDGATFHVDDDRTLFYNPDLCEGIRTKFRQSFWWFGETGEALIYAATKARQARFEHGEKPTI